MPLPEYIVCHSKYITHCDFYMHSDCPETCGYAKNIKGIEDVVLGVGAPMIDPTRVRRMEDQDG